MNWRLRLLQLYSNASAYLKVEAIAFFYFLGYGVFNGASHPAFYQKVCMETYPSQWSVCCYLNKHKQQENVVQTLTANWVMYNEIAKFVPVICGGVLFGSFGDCYGWKLPLLVSQASMILYVAFYLAFVTLEALPLYSLIIAAITCSLGGNFVTFLTAIFSELADSVDVKKCLTSRYTILMAFWKLGSLTGGYVASGLLTVVSVQYVIMVALAIVTATFLYCVVRLPDPRPRRKQTAEKSGPLALFKQGMSLYRRAFQTVGKPRPNYGRMKLAIVCVVSVVYASEDSGLTRLSALFAFHTPLSWEADMLSTWLATNSASALIGSLAMAYVAQKLRLSALTCILIGVVSECLRMAVIAASVYTWLMFVGTVAGCFSGFGVAAVLSYVVQLGSEEESGELLACVISFVSLFSIYSAVVYNNLYTATLTIYRGFVFAYAAVTMLVCFFVLLTVKITEDTYRKTQCGKEMAIDRSETHVSTIARF